MSDGAVCWKCKRLVREEDTVCMAGVGTQCHPVCTPPKVAAVPVSAQDPQPEVDRIVAALDDACKRSDWAFVRAVIACADTFRRHLPDGGHVPPFRCGECGGADPKAHM